MGNFLKDFAFYINLQVKGSNALLLEELSH